MTFGRIFDIMAAIVTVAAIAVIVSAPHTAAVIESFGKAFADSISAAVAPATKR